MKKLFPLFLILLLTFFFVASVSAATSDIYNIQSVGFFATSTDRNVYPSMSITMPDSSVINLGYSQSYSTNPAGSFHGMLEFGYSTRYLEDSEFGVVSFVIDDLPQPILKFSVPHAIVSNGVLSYDFSVIDVDVIVYKDNHYYESFINGNSVPEFVLSEGVNLSGATLFTEASSEYDLVDIGFTRVHDFNYEYFVFDDIYSEYNNGSAYILYLIQYLKYCLSHFSSTRDFLYTHTYIQTFTCNAFPDVKPSTYNVLKKLLSDSDARIELALQGVSDNVVESLNDIYFAGDGRFDDFSDSLSDIHERVVSSREIIDDYTSPSSRDFAGGGSHFTHAIDLSNTDQALSASYRGVLNTIFNNSLISVIVLAGAFLSILGYLIFGKR